MGSRFVLRVVAVVILAFIIVLPSEAARGERRRGAERGYWVETMVRIVRPVYENLARGTLRRNMPVEVNDGTNEGKRADVTHLEALGRSFNGIAPWLALGAEDTAEGRLRAEMTDLVVRAITNAVDPDSPDYMPFDRPGGQPLVDAAFFAEGLLRAKDAVWPRLDKVTQQRVVEELRRSRSIKPYESNWLLFSAMVEAALLELTGECEMAPVEYALNRHMEWYKGDGWYGDGPSFHLDYYNSYVIQPMLLDVTAVMRAHAAESEAYAACGALYDKVARRLSRFAAQQEMLISPEGSYPMLGRSSGYRYGAFHALSQAALLHLLPEELSPAAVRSALTAVIRRQTVPETFDRDGGLRSDSADTSRRWPRAMSLRAAHISARLSSCRSASPPTTPSGALRPRRGAHSASGAASPSCVMPPSTIDRNGIGKRIAAPAEPNIEIFVSALGFLYL